MGWRGTTVVLGLLFSLHLGLLTCEAVSDSPVQHEPANLCSGMLIWTQGRFDVYRVNPPLVRAIAAFPLWISGHTSGVSELAQPFHRPELHLGSLWLASQGASALRQVAIARAVCFPISLLGASVCFLWSKELFGARSGVMAAALWCLDPTIVGNGHLAMPDVAAASLSLLAAYAFARWHRQPTWSRAALAGACMGLALATKFTCVVLLLLIPSGVLALWFGKPTVKSRAIVDPSIMLVAFVITLNGCYAWDGTFRSLKSFTFVSAALTSVEQSPSAPPLYGNRFRDTVMGRIRVPLPEQFIAGIDEQWRDFEVGMPSYIAGRSYSEGWIGYYLYGALVKEPVGLWLLAAVAVLVFVRMPWLCRRSRSEVALIALLWLLYLALVSVNVGVNRHYRYVLPALPFAFILISRTATCLSRRSPVSGVIVIATLAWTIGAAVWAVPHSLAYFNELAGGARHGHHHLLGSNLDWGQDLIRLREWLDQNPHIGPIALDCDSSYDPRIIVGDRPELQVLNWEAANAVMNERRVVERKRPRYLILSANRLHTMRYERLSAADSVNQIGATMYLFKLPDERNETTPQVKGA